MSLRISYDYSVKKLMKCPNCGRTIRSNLTFIAPTDAFIGYKGICKCGYEPAYG